MFSESCPLLINLQKFQHGMKLNSAKANEHLCSEDFESFFKYNLFNAEKKVFELNISLLSLNLFYQRGCCYLVEKYPNNNVSYIMFHAFLFNMSQNLNILPNYALYQLNFTVCKKIIKLIKKTFFIKFKEN
ncbi:hypothetical protein HZS_2829 [Henneguya salminicola]|nr:hypothetical protein HZS_2829 [Henneguya salminicola]